MTTISTAQRDIATKALGGTSSSQTQKSESLLETFERLLDQVATQVRQAQHDVPLETPAPTTVRAVAAPAKERNAEAPRAKGAGKRKKSSAAQPTQEEVAEAEENSAAPAEESAPAAVETKDEPEHAESAEVTATETAAAPVVTRAPAEAAAEVTSESVAAVQQLIESDGEGELDEGMAECGVVTQHVERNEEEVTPEVLEGFFQTTGRQASPDSTGATEADGSAPKTGSAPVTQAAGSKSAEHSEAEADLEAALAEGTTTDAVTTQTAVQTQQSPDATVTAANAASESSETAASAETQQAAPQEQPLFQILFAQMQRLGLGGATQGKVADPKESNAASQQIKLEASQKASPATGKNFEPFSFGAQQRLEQRREQQSEKASARPLPRHTALRTMEKVELALREVARGRDGKSLSFRLDPPDLGTVKIDVSLRDGVLRARVVPESPQVSKLLSERAHELQGALRSLGLEVDSVIVAVGPEQAVPEKSEGDQNGGSSVYDQAGDRTAREEQGGEQAGDKRAFVPVIPEIGTREAVTDGSWIA